MPNYWKKEEKMVAINKPILITGGSGHIGLNLLKKVNKLYSPVYLLVRNTERRDANGVKLIRADLSNKKEINKYRDILKKIKIVVHLAAHVPKKKGEDNFNICMQVNLTGTMNLVSYLSKGAKFIFASTCEVYGKPMKGRIRETHPLKPTSYYGLSKLLAEKALGGYCKRKGINLTILRFTSVYGPGEIINRAIPNFVRNVIKETSPVIYGDGSDLRDFIYLDDAVNSILASIKKGKNTVYNIATGSSNSIKDVAERIIKLSGKDLKIKFKKRKVDKIDLGFDVSRANRDIGYLPKISLNQGLKKELMWFNKND